jgi:hypothetical protein
MVEAAQSYEMVCKFNNFKTFVMFAVKKLQALLISIFLTMITFVLKIFLNYLPPRKIK